MRSWTRLQARALLCADCKAAAPLTPAGTAERIPESRLPRKGGAVRTRATYPRRTQRRSRSRPSLLVHA